MERGRRFTALLIVLVLLIANVPATSFAVDSFNNGLAEQLTFTPPVVDTSRVGYGIQRTMQLLETSTPEHKNTVRIAFCGQSITDGNNNKWPAAVIAYLKFKYPNADIQVQNFGIGGYNTWLMGKILPNDISSFYPDLVFFYDYGDMYLYESFIKFIRETTTAEVIIQTEHIDTGTGFGSEVNSTVNLPQIANDYGCELANVRTNWQNYLTANSLSASSVLSDTVHLNAQGQALMYEILKQYFVYRPYDTSTYDDRTDTFTISSKLAWNNSTNTLTLPFKGNRIEMVSPVQNGFTGTVKINGTKPSNFLELYNTTRYTNLTNHVYAAYYNNIVFLKPVPPQTWTIEFTRIGTTKNDYDFTITGSINGAEGSGNCLSDFTTTSGSMLFQKNYFYNKATPAVGKKLIFDTTFNGTDNVIFSGTEKLASNLPLMDNTLVLTNTSATTPTFAAIKAYRPGFLYFAPVVNEIKLFTYKISGFCTKGADVSVFVNGTKTTGKADANGNFQISVPPIKAGSTVEVRASLYGTNSQLFRYKLPGTMAPPVISKIAALNSSATKIFGTATNSATVKATIGKFTYTGKASSTTGNFSISIPKQKPGISVKLQATLFSVSSKIKTIVVKPIAPVFNKISVKSKGVSGAAYAKGTLTILYNGKLFKKVTVPSTGKFSVALKTKIVAGKYFTAYVKYGGATSDTAKVKVAK